MLSEINYIFASMKEFISHIDYLVQKHDCVIIPDFGGFVLNHEGAMFTADGSMIPPKVTIGFNPDLKYNDGLLAQSYMDMYSISYDEALMRVAESVQRLNTILYMGHPIQIGKLGKLSLDKNDILSFIPNDSLSLFHPETFGLSRMNMKRLSVLEKEKNKIRRKSVLKYVLAGTASAAAAVVLFFTILTPSKDHENNLYKSGFLTDMIISPSVSSVESSSSSETISEEKIQEDQPEVVADTDDFVNYNSVIISATQDSNCVDNNKYSIIIGSLPNKKDADVLLTKVHKEGLSTASIVEPAKRKRIYVSIASLASKNGAEQYLNKFVKEYPKYADAWIYTQE